MNMKAQTTSLSRTTQAHPGRNMPFPSLQSALELEDLPPYQQYEVKVEARNSYGEALEETAVVAGFSGQDGE